MNPYRPTDIRRRESEPVATPKIAPCGFLASVCFAVGSIGLPVGVVLIHTFAYSSHLSQYSSVGLPLGIFVLWGAAGLLLLGAVRMRSRARGANTKSPLELEKQELPKRAFVSQRP